MNEDTRSDKPYKLGDGSYTTLAELAAALAENHELAGEHIERGYVQKWIEEDLRDYDARIALDKLLEENVTELALFEFALRYAPQWTPMIEGLPVQAEFLDEYLPQLLKDDYVVCTQELANFAGSLYSWGVLTDERVSKGNAERWAAIDAAWRREFHDTLLTHGEMLLYRSLWNAPGSALDDALLEDRHLELIMACAAAGSADHDPANFEKLKTILASKEKLALLAELWVAEEPNAQQSPRLKVEDGLYYEQAIKRPWFADMLASEALRTPGRETELLAASKIAAAQQHDIEREAETATADPTAKPSGNFFAGLGKKLSALDPKIRAAAFALPVLITTFFYDRWSGDLIWALLTWAALALTIGLGALRPLPIKPDKRWIDFAGAVAIGWGIFAFFAEDFHYSLIVYEAIFAAIAGALGFLWNPLGNVREKAIERGLQRTQSASAQNDPSRITPDALATLFFPERILDIPFANRTPKQKAFTAAVNSGHADTTGLARYADRRSPVAPNHGAGFSTSMGGFNVASDGTTTMEAMDGVSMDTKGNWNMRVADGVTLHKDGKHTISMGGFDVRSDGQISTEVGGFRFSSGGGKKEEKSSWFDPKEETDWFGNKKKKGWFD